MSKKQRDSFVFYRTFAEVLQELPPEEQLQLLWAIIRYALDYEQPRLKGIPKTLFRVFVPLIDANWRRYKNGCKGGAPSGNTNALKQPKNNQETTKKQPYYNYNDNFNLNLNDNGDITPEQIF